MEGQGMFMLILLRQQEQKDRGQPCAEVLDQDRVLVVRAHLHTEPGRVKTIITPSAASPFTGWSAIFWDHWWPVVSASDSAVLAGGRAEFKPRLSAAKGQARGAQLVQRRESGGAVRSKGTSRCRIIPPRLWELKLKIRMFWISISIGLDQGLQHCCTHKHPYKYSSLASNYFTSRSI